MDMTTGQPVPKATRLCRYWWNGDTELWYGDICALRAGDHIYAYSHAKDSPWIYLVRANIYCATDLNAYENWNGGTWQRERLRLAELDEKQSIFWKVQQGQVIWSNHHQRFLFVYCDAWWSNQVLVSVSHRVWELYKSLTRDKIKTASVPKGPWSEPMTVHKAELVQEEGCIYSAIPHS
jgi:hypothetical protein